MKISVTSGFGGGYTFTVEKDKEYETVDDVIKVCLELEAVLCVEDEEEEYEDEEDE